MMTNKGHPIVRKPPSAFVVLGMSLFVLSVILGTIAFAAEASMIRNALAQRAIQFEQDSVNAVALHIKMTLKEDRTLLAGKSFPQVAHLIERMPRSAATDLFPFQHLWFSSMGGRPPVHLNRFDNHGYYLSGNTLWMKTSTLDGPGLASIPLGPLFESAPSGNGLTAIIIGSNYRIVLTDPPGPYVGLNALPQLHRAISRSHKSGVLFFNTRIGPSFVSYRRLDDTGLIVAMIYPENLALAPSFSIGRLILQVVVISAALVGIIFLVIWLWYRRRVANLERTAEAIASGQFALRLPEQGPRELWLIARAANRAVEALVSARNLHSSLRKAYAALLNDRSEEVILQTVVQEATKVEQAQLVILFLPDHSGRRLVAHTWSGPASEYAQQMGSKTPVPEIHDGGPADLAFTEKQAIVVHDTQADQRFCPWKAASQEYGLLSMAAVPVQVGGEVLGVLSVYDSTPEAFPIDRVARILQFAEASAFTLMRIREGKRLVYLASTDVLTGLSNRRHFEIQFPALLARALRAKQPFCLVVMDLDRFKQLNDTQGHQAGDLCLAEVGANLRTVMREGDLAVRLGGDEFMLFLLTDQAGCRAALDRILPVLPLEKWGVSISGGVAAFPDDGRDYDALYRRADERMYEAKRAGGNFVSFPTVPACDESRQGTLTVE